ncbi:hypothetical protein T459_09630 [Capsicum annuum]|uniref:Uncharacterized protein n=1 Tax=Capsicum annuum TaxID=4072 RepID=A0A2G2ZZV7_CAPAN|nr:uncharacterized protein LOC107863100 isoform X2 [Capsicum annuum]PHT87524.1 hypothetical protein T459_09630 [Capsicum annuum]
MYIIEAKIRDKTQIGLNHLFTGRVCEFWYLFPKTLIINQQPIASHRLYNNCVQEGMDGVASSWDFQCNLEVDLGSEENAHIVYTALAVDKELQPDKVKRHMSVSNGKLSVNFEAVEARFLRASFSAFVDVLTLATKTIEEFGPKKE